MALQLGKSSIDIGILIRDSDRSLAFYRDLLGLEHVADRALPAAWSGVMHVLACGDSLVKLVRLDEVPDHGPVEPPRLEAALGYRYWTIRVTNLDVLLDECVAAGVSRLGPIVPVDGARFALISDPDDNIVELLEATDDPD